MTTDLRRAALEQFVRRVSELTITAWERDGEPVVTMPKSDAIRLLRLIDRARELRAARGLQGEPNR